MTAADDALNRLREVAEAADDEGRSWEWEHAYPQRVTRVGDVILVADCYEDPDAPSRFAEFIATFDPPKVLSLLTELQRLREERDFFRERYQKLDNQIGAQYRDMQYRAEAAEAEVRRYREGLREIRRDCAQRWTMDKIDALVADSPDGSSAREPHEGDYEPPEVDDWRPGDYRPDGGGAK